MEFLCLSLKLRIDKIVPESFQVLPAHSREAGESK